MSLLSRGAAAVLAIGLAIVIVLHEGCASGLGSPEVHGTGRPIADQQLAGLLIWGFGGLAPVIVAAALLPTGSTG